jgi:putative transposase
MPRKARELYSNQYYHLICRSNNHIFIFKEPDDFQKYLGLAHYYFREQKVKCFHYCLMNTHAHFVVQLPDNIELISEMMKVIHQKYAMYYQKKYDYSGHVWGDRFKNELIDTDRYMLGCGLYLEHNPVKAGMVSQPEEYPWSSYGHWVGMRKDPLLSEHPLDIKQYRTMADDYISAYLDYVKLVSIPRGRPRRGIH